MESTNRSSAGRCEHRRFLALPPPPLLQAATISASVPWSLSSIRVSACAPPPPPPQLFLAVPPVAASVSALLHLRIAGVCPGLLSLGLSLPLSLHGLVFLALLISCPFPSHCPSPISPCLSVSFLCSSLYLCLVSVPPMPTAVSVSLCLKSPCWVHPSPLHALHWHSRGRIHQQCALFHRLLPGLPALTMTTSPQTFQVSINLACFLRQP